MQSGVISKALIEALDAARTFSLNANVDFTSTKPAFNEAFTRISDTYDDFTKPLINDIFRQLGFLTTKDGAPPALGIFTHNFCNEWTEREWINDSTPAVFEHIKIIVHMEFHLVFKLLL